MSSSTTASQKRNPLKKSLVPSLYKCRYIISLYELRWASHIQNSENSPDLHPLHPQQMMLRHSTLHKLYSSRRNLIMTNKTSTNLITTEQVVASQVHSSIQNIYD